MTYDPRYHQRTRNLEDEIGGYAGYEDTIVKLQRTHRPARHLRNTEQAIIAERLARQQAIDEAREKQQPRSHRTSNRTPQRAMYTQPNRAIREDDELYGDEDLLTRLPRSARRYRPDEVYQQGNKRVHMQYFDVPPRRTAQAQIPKAPQQEYPMYEDEDEREAARPPKRRRRGVHVHWLSILGIGMICMLALVLAGNSVISWWTIHQDDAMYGRPRTFQIDQVVGHNDSKDNPSHFIAENLNRHIIVIELPGGDSSKARIYAITTLFGDGQELTPVTLSFKDVNGGGLLDMEVHIQGQTIMFINENGAFRPLKSGEHVQL